MELYHLKNYVLDCSIVRKSFSD